MVVTPRAYQRWQDSQARRFLSQNEFIDFAVASRLGIPNAAAYMKQRFPDGIALKSCFLSSGVLQRAVCAAEDSLADGMWANIAAILVCRGRLTSN